MDLTNYVTFDDIRAALGVSKAEISDATISLDIYANGLVHEFEELDLGIIPLYESLQEIESPSANQLRFRRSLRLFATYSVANNLCTSLPMFGPKEQTDGKVGLIRFATDPYKVTITAIGAKYNTYKAALIAAYSAIQVVTVTDSALVSYFSVSSPDYDPILGA